TVAWHIETQLLCQVCCWSNHSKACRTPLRQRNVARCSPRVGPRLRIPIGLCARSASRRIRELLMTAKEEPTTISPPEASSNVLMARLRCCGRLSTQYTTIRLSFAEQHLYTR